MKALVVPAALDGRRWCLLSAGVGAFAWAVGVLVLAPGWAPVLFLFAPLVLVPLGLSLLAPERKPAGLWRFGLGLQLPAALLLLAAFGLPAGPLAAALTLPWLALTAILALLGGQRLRGSGLGSAPEVCLTAGLLYPVVGGAWLFLSRLGAQPLGFSDIIVLATAVHFHYAGFVLPLLTGRTIRHMGWVSGRLAATGVVLGVPAVAVGITLSAFGCTFPELAAAWFLAGTTILVADLQLRLTRRARPLGKLLLGISSLALFSAMGLAGAYALGSYLGIAWLDIPQMLPWHGAVNAFGFALPGLLAWVCDPSTSPPP